MLVHTKNKNEYISFLGKMVHSFTYSFFTFTIVDKLTNNKYEHQYLELFCSLLMMILITS